MRTTVGYTGGTTVDPDYRHIGDHSEAIRIDFDPNRISYAQLLDVFWESHDPTFQNWSRQYRNVIFPLTKEQESLAGNSRRQLAARSGRSVVSEIEPAGPFYPAEDYHQKYLLRKADTLFAELQRHYPDERELITSTAAARLNGYLGCNGDAEILQGEIGALGLSSPLQKRLIEYVSAGCSGFSGLTCPAPE
ncbi:MAG: peptide methionine sulfoxide reductase [Desulfuromonas sp.]|nr:MAG: peptide methionine sulfoxide reductase [Desulfuromonas sp.]